MPGRPPLTRLTRTTRTTLAVGLVVALAGCADTVAVDPPDPGADIVSLCADLLADAPATVAGEEAVRVAPAGAGRAWGSPAIVMRCGVEQPAALAATSRCDVVDDVGWFSQEDDDRFLFTTIGRTAYVEVSVPRAYDPPSDALSDLAETIDANDPVEKPCV